MTPRILASLCVIGVATGLCFNPAAAQTPLYFDPELRKSAPDLSGLPRLRFITSLDFPPFNFADANKKPTGLNVDLARAICAELSIAAKCEIQAMPWNDLEDALTAKRGEAIIAGTSITNSKRQNFALSEAYFKFPARFVGARDFQFPKQSDLVDVVDGKKVGVVEGTAHAAMLKEYFARAEIVDFPDQQAAYSALMANDVELTFSDGVSASFWLTSRRANNCCRFVGDAYYADRFLGLGMSIVTRKEDKVLMQAINAALSAIEQSGTYSEIFQRYFPNSPHAPED